MRSPVPAAVCAAVLSAVPFSACKTEHDFDCNRDSDCAPGMICWQEICQIPFSDAGETDAAAGDAGCVSDDQCGAGEWCRNQRCEPLPDGGPDTEPRDATETGDAEEAGPETGPDVDSGSEIGPDTEIGVDTDTCIPDDEICDGADNDCDGDIDEDATDAPTWYRDADADGWGVDLDTRVACAAPEGFAAELGDCRDDDAMYHPGADESCDEPFDYNCDRSVAFADADADGVPACEDCHDDDATAHPGATDLPGDEIDSDCDGIELCFVDADSDRWRTDDTVASSNESCDNMGEARAFEPAGDCDDANPVVNPERDEVCEDGLDDDCSGRDDACRLVGRFDADNADVILRSTEAGAWFGYSAAAGDFNGDGFDDLLVGAPMAALEFGAAYVLFGRADLSGPIASSGLTALQPTGSGAHTGFAVAAGDFNRDGRADAVVGAPHLDVGSFVEAGTVFVLYGADTWSSTVDLATSDLRLTGTADDLRLGMAGLLLHDVNADGFDDLAAGSVSGDGAVWIVAGRAGLRAEIPLTVATTALTVDCSNCAFGASLGAGDMDDDGYDELLVGTTGMTNGASPAGGVWAVHFDDAFPLSMELPGVAGDSTRIVGPVLAGLPMAGSAVASGDFNRDGIDEIAVASGLMGVAPSNYPGFYLVPGRLAWRADELLADGIEFTAGPASGLGTRLAVGDFDADGTDDLLAGEAFWSSELATRGTARILWGAGALPETGSWEGTPLFAGAVDHDGLGGALAAGDFNGDGIDDVVACAPGADGTGSDHGACYIFFGGSVEP